MIHWVCHEVNCKTWSRGYARLCDSPKTSSSHRLAFRCVAWLQHHRSHFDRLFFFLTCWGVQKMCRTISAKIEISAKLLRILRQMVIECNWIWTAGKSKLNLPKFTFSKLLSSKSLEFYLQFRGTESALLNPQRRLEKHFARGTTEITMSGAANVEAAVQPFKCKVCPCLHFH